MAQGQSLDNAPRFAWRQNQAAYLARLLITEAKIVKGGRIRKDGCLGSNYGERFSGLIKGMRAASENSRRPTCCPDLVVRRAVARSPKS